MRPSQLGEWAALWTIDPQGQERADLRAGVIASTIANVHRDSKKRPRPFRADEFTLKFGAEAVPKRTVREAMREWFPNRVRKSAKQGK